MQGNGVPGKADLPTHIPVSFHQHTTDSHFCKVPQTKQTEHDGPDCGWLSGAKKGLFPQASQQPYPSAWILHMLISDTHSNRLTYFLLISSGVRKIEEEKDVIIQLHSYLGSLAVWPSHTVIYRRGPRPGGKWHCSWVARWSESHFKVMCYEGKHSAETVQSDDSITRDL